MLDYLEVCAMFQRQIRKFFKSPLFIDHEGGKEVAPLFNLHK